MRKNKKINLLGAFSLRSAPLWYLTNCKTHLWMNVCDWVKEQINFKAMSALHQTNSRQTSTPMKTTVEKGHSLKSQLERLKSSRNNLVKWCAIENVLKNFLIQRHL